MLRPDGISLHFLPSLFLYDDRMAASKTANPLRREQRQHVYVGAVTSLAVFLASLFVTGGIALEQVASTTVHLTGASGQRAPAGDDLWQQKLLGDAQLQKLLARTGLQQRPAAAVREQMRLQVAVGGASADVHVRIEFADSSPAAAAALVSQCAGYFAEEHRQQTHAEMSAALASMRWKTQQAQDQWMQAEADLHAFLVERFSAADPRASLDARALPWPVGDAPRNPIRLVANQEPIGHSIADDNAEESADALRTELEYLFSKREQLLTTMTVEHPDIVRIDARIGEIQILLRGASLPTAGGGAASAERHGDRPPQLPAGPQLGNPQLNNPQVGNSGRWNSGGEQFPRPLQPQDELIKGYRQRAENIVALSERVAAAVEAEEAVWKSYRDAAPGKLATVDAMRMSFRPDRAQLRRHLLLLAALAACCGLAMFYIARSGAESFTGAEQAVRELPNAIVVESPLRAAPKPGGRLLTRRFAGVVKTSAEMLLAAAIFWFFVLAWFDARFVTDFAGDPLAVVAQGMERTAEILNK